MQASLLLALALSTAPAPCDPGFACAERIVAAETKQSGVAAGFSAIERLAGETQFEVRGREHNLAHTIGHVLAETSDVEGSALLRCPDDWSFGCQHGFIEEILTESRASLETLYETCSSISDWERRFRCLHGIGHGLTMWNGNHFGRALRDCDALEAGSLSFACHQAVFHEAFKLWDAGKAPAGTYDDRNPLFPCDAIDSRYRWGCYSRHAARLLAFEHYDVRRASRWCLLVEEQFLYPCIAEFGQYIANPRSRNLLLRQTDVTLEEGDAETQAAAFCEQTMPEGFADFCKQGAIAHLQSRGTTVTGGVHRLPFPGLTRLQRIHVLLLRAKIRLARLHTPDLSLYTPS